MAQHITLMQIDLTEGGTEAKINEHVSVANGAGYQLISTYTLNHVLFLVFSKG